MRDLDELYIMYEELVEAGEIDPKYTSVEAFVEDQITSLIDSYDDMEY
jgi:hypothetical protein